MGRWSFPVLATSLPGLRNIRTYRRLFFTEFIQTTARQLNTKVYKHIVSLLSVSAFFGQIQGNIRQWENKQLAEEVIDVQS